MSFWLRSRSFSRAKVLYSAVILNHWCRWRKKTWHSSVNRICKWRPSMADYFCIFHQQHSTTTTTLLLMSSGISSAWKFSSDKEDEPKTRYENTRCATVSHKRREFRDIAFQDDRSYYRWERNYTEPGVRESSHSCCLVLFDSKLCDIGNGQKYQRICKREESRYTDKWPIKGFKVEGRCIGGWKCQNLGQRECRDRQ